MSNGLRQWILQWLNISIPDELFLTFINDLEFNSLLPPLIVTIAAAVHHKSPSNKVQSRIHSKIIFVLFNPENLKQRTTFNNCFSDAILRDSTVFHSSLTSSRHTQTELVLEYWMINQTVLIFVCVCMQHGALSIWSFIQNQWYLQIWSVKMTLTSWG